MHMYMNLLLYILASMYVCLRLLNNMVTVIGKTYLKALLQKQTGQIVGRKDHHLNAKKNTATYFSTD